MTYSNNQQMQIHKILLYICETNACKTSILKKKGNILEKYQSKVSLNWFFTFTWNALSKYWQLSVRTDRYNTSSHTHWSCNLNSMNQMLSATNDYILITIKLNPGLMGASIWSIQQTDFQSKNTKILRPTNTAHTGFTHPILSVWCRVNIRLT
jgi:hypothetical protein